MTPSYSKRPTHWVWGGAAKNAVDQLNSKKKYTQFGTKIRLQTVWALHTNFKNACVMTPRGPKLHISIIFTY